LASLLKRLEERKLTVTLSGEARDFVIHEGYDPVYGARPLKRTLQRRLLDPLALKVLQGDFREGDIVRVEVDRGALVLNRETAPLPASSASA
jgi:ATP-dependent Clp protease ATP-binding subunit ClpB